MFNAKRPVDLKPDRLSSTPLSASGPPPPSVQLYESSTAFLLLGVHTHRPCTAVSHHVVRSN
jgi:hypothetical protein